MKSFGSRLPQRSASDFTPIFIQKAVDRCHVRLPDSAQPTSAIVFEGEYYVFVRFFPREDAARQKAKLMRSRGNKVILTRVVKGLVLWVCEPDAQPTERYQLVQTPD